MRDELEEQRRQISYLVDLADQDTLTPVINRRAFVRELTRIVSYGERYATPSSLLYIDLNGLKQINDTYGHAAGDAALTKLATILTEQIRGSDIVGRLGGDEFGVLLVHADEAVATEKALHLTDMIDANPLTWESHEIPINVSFGAHTFTSGIDPDDALAAADRAMYKQKNARKAAAEP
jgi:diguanylate cyclase (GGDEF)-like protein